MKKTIKMAMVVIAMVAIATVGFVGGIQYANNNTEAHINELGEITVWNNNTCISTRELTTREVSHVEANNEEKEVLTQNLVPASTSKEVREQELVSIKNKELTQTLVPASTTVKGGDR